MAFDSSSLRIGEHLVINVGGNNDGVRLDNYLCSRFGQLSRAKMQRIIRDQTVLVNGKKAKPSRKLNCGDKVEIDLPSRELLAEQMPINIIHEDDQIIVINKQPGVIIHPARGNSNGTLINGLLYHAQNTSSDENEYVPGVVHRLDKNTSGTMVFAKSDYANTHLSEQFQERKTSKKYLAVVHGRIEADSGVIDKPMGIDPRYPEKYAVREDGKEAVTLFEVVERFDEFTVVGITLKTGRTHQIRVHFSDMGNPLVADETYGGRVVCASVKNDAENKVELMSRVALHSQILGFEHPGSGKWVEFESELPDDIQHFINSISMDLHFH